MQTIESLLRENELLKKEDLALRSTGESAQVYRESQDRFRAVFEASRLGNKIISSELSILQVNAAMVELMGYDTKADLIGKKILDYSPTECHKDWRFLQEKLWAKSTPYFSLETCLRRKDGAVIWCQVTSILFEDHGQTLGYTIIEDISEKYFLRAQREEFISVPVMNLKHPSPACAQVYSWSTG